MNKVSISSGLICFPTPYFLQSECEFFEKTRHSCRCDHKGTIFSAVRLCTCWTSFLFLYTVKGLAFTCCWDCASKLEFNTELSTIGLGSGRQAVSAVSLAKMHTIAMS